MVHARLAAVLLPAVACSLPASSQPADAARIAEAVLRGTTGAALAQQAVIQMFTELDSGGIQRVVARDPGDELQAHVVRRRLRDTRDAFLLGDIPQPAHLPDADLPALARLRDAAPGRVLVGYRDIPAGGELTCYSWAPALVDALHDWFDTLASDPDADAVVAHLRGRRRPVPSSR